MPTRVRLSISTRALARKCAARPWLTIGIWGLVLIAALSLIATMLGGSLTTHIGPTGNPESTQARRLINERFPPASKPTENTEVVLVRSTDRKVDHPVFQSYVEELFQKFLALGPGVITGGFSYYQSKSSTLVSLDMQTAAMVLTLAPGQPNLDRYFAVYAEMGQDQWQVPKDPLDPDRGKGEFRVHSFNPGPGNEYVIVSSQRFTVEDDEYRSLVSELFYDTVALGRSVVWGGSDYYTSGDRSQVSGDGHATIISLSLSNDELVSTVQDAVLRARANKDFNINITGDASFMNDFNVLSAHDLKNGELAVGLPIAVVILILVFGALVTAMIPLAVALVSITIALGASTLFAQVTTISVFLVNMVFMMGLAVGIDYCLFIVVRYREERAHGQPRRDAIERTGATASRAVLFSGITVFLALIALMLIPHNVFVSLGLGAVLVILVSIAASLTLLPALLSLLGDRVNSLRIPLIYRRQGKSVRESGGMWDRISRTVMWSPILSLVLAGGLLIAAAVPVLDMNIGFGGISTFPDRLESKKGFVALEQYFSAGLTSPTTIVVDGTIDRADVQGAIDRLTAFLAQDHSFGSVSEQINPGRDLAKLDVAIGGGDSTSQAAREAVERLRKNYIPFAFAGVPARALVTGDTAEWVDQITIARNGLRVTVPFILVMSFVLLTLAFRSIVVPIKAVVMNLLSVGAAYGLMVLVFQTGVGNRLLGFEQVAAIEWWVPAFLFAVLFGLSMDYHVFLLSRIRERFLHTRDNTGSVAYGIRTTGRLITGAALIMVAVFGGFAAGDLVMFQQMGFGLAVSILLDALLVRTVLVPASMKLLGDRNWYLPRWLRWLPRISAEESIAAENGNRAPVPEEPR